MNAFRALAVLAASMALSAAWASASLAQDTVVIPSGGTGTVPVGTSKVLNPGSEDCTSQPGTSVKVVPSNALDVVTPLQGFAFLPGAPMSVRVKPGVSPGVIIGISWATTGGNCYSANGIVYVKVGPPAKSGPGSPADPAFEKRVEECRALMDNLIAGDKRQLAEARRQRRDAATIKAIEGMIANDTRNRNRCAETVRLEDGPAKDRVARVLDDMGDYAFDTAKQLAPKAVVSTVKFVAGRPKGRNEVKALVLIKRELNKARAITYGSGAAMFGVMGAGLKGAAAVIRAVPAPQGARTGAARIHGSPIATAAIRPARIRPSRLVDRQTAAALNTLVADQVRVVASIRALRTAAEAPTTVHMAALLHRLATHLRIAQASWEQARTRLFALQRALPRALRRLRARAPSLTRAESRRRLRTLVRWANLDSDELGALLRGAAAQPARTARLDVRRLLPDPSRTQATQKRVADALSALADSVAQTP